MTFRRGAYEMYPLRSFLYLLLIVFATSNNLLVFLDIGDNI